MSFKQKYVKAKAILAAGDYKEFFDCLYSNFFPKNRGNRVYSRLQRKYSNFINEYKYAKLQTGGGDCSGHENIIWRLWLQGTDEAPEICKACLESLKRWHNDKKIITLDKNNLHEYITLPDYINEKYEKGIISHTHYSDIVRAELLSRYGGIWADATVFCTGRKFEYIMNLPLFIFRENNFASVSSSWFIVSAPNNPIIMLTRDLLFEYWKEHNYLTHYFLFHMFFKMATEKYKDEWAKVPFISNRPPHEMQRSMYEDYDENKMKYFASLSDIHKMTYKIKPKKAISPSSIYQHIINTL